MVVRLISWVHLCGVCVEVSLAWWGVCDGSLLLGPEVWVCACALSA